jgi:hypothetical protein
MKPALVSPFFLLFATGAFAAAYDCTVQVSEPIPYREVVYKHAAGEPLWDFEKGALPAEKVISDETYNPQLNGTGGCGEARPGSAWASTEKGEGYASWQCQYEHPEIKFTIDTEKCTDFGPFCNLDIVDAATGKVVYVGWELDRADKSMNAWDQIHVIPYIRIRKGDEKLFDTFSVIVQAHHHVGSAAGFNPAIGQPTIEAQLNWVDPRESYPLPKVKPREAAQGSAQVTCRLK